MAYRTGGASLWPAILVGALFLLICALVYGAYTALPPPSPKAMALGVRLPTQPPDAPRLPAAPVPSPR
jgi:hypothetical protein